MNRTVGGRSRATGDAGGTRRLIGIGSIRGEKLIWVSLPGSRRGAGVRVDADAPLPADSDRRVH